MKLQFFRVNKISVVINEPSVGNNKLEIPELYNSICH